jgi:hypothetical protein
MSATRRRATTCRARRRAPATQTRCAQPVCSARSRHNGRGPHLVTRPARPRCLRLRAAARHPRSPAADCLAAGPSRIDGPRQVGTNPPRGGPSIIPAPPPWTSVPPDAARPPPRRRPASCFVIRPEPWRPSPQAGCRRSTGSARVVLQVGEISRTAARGDAATRACTSVTARRPLSGDDVRAVRGAPKPISPVAGGVARVRVQQLALGAKPLHQGARRHARLRRDRRRASAPRPDAQHHPHHRREHIRHPPPSGAVGSSRVP